MTDNPYVRLARALDALPEGFPPTESGVELRLLAELFTPEEAALAAELGLDLESAPEIAARAGLDARTARGLLKGMARRGLIRAGRAERGLGYALLPFVVGIYEMQGATLTAELAHLFEAYYHEAFGRMAGLQPPVHRVIPVGESVRVDLEVRPFESAVAIVEEAQAWGVTDCVCRKQQALVGSPCDHPLDVCMILGQSPGAFGDPEDGRAVGPQLVRPITREEALATLRRAAEAGLVHSVSNSREGLWYVCNCCTCACGILRGMVELGLHNVVAPSPFVSRVDAGRCVACGECVARCPFGALNLGEVARVDALLCAGCGVCVPSCPVEALTLERRPPGEVASIPEDLEAWRAARGSRRE
jgi:ferredoxin